MITFKRESTVYSYNLSITYYIQYAYFLQGFLHIFIHFTFLYEYVYTISKKNMLPADILF